MAEDSLSRRGPPSPEEFERLITEPGPDGLSLIQFTTLRSRGAHRAYVLKGIPRDFTTPDDLTDEALVAYHAESDLIKDSRAWITTVVRNLAAQAVRQLGPLGPEVDENAPAGEPGKIEEQVDPAFNCRLLDAIGSLSPKLRAVAALRLIEGRSPAAIAEVLHLDPGVVRVRWHRARKLLQKALRDLRPA